MSLFRNGTRSALLIAAAAAGAAAGCASEEVGAVYRLARAGNDTLPVALRVEDGCQHLLRGGEVMFYGDRRYRSSFHIEVVCPGRAPLPVAGMGTAGRVRIARDTAFFSDSAGAPAGFGTLGADSLVIQGATHRLIYRRAVFD